MLLVAILNFILIFICELLGAACIATAIKYLKKEDYFGFGLGIMACIFAILFMAKIMFC